MYRLIELVMQNNKESQAIYTFDTYEEAKGEFETKVGADMKSQAYTGFILMILDNTGKVLDNKHSGDVFSQRLIEVKVTDEETPDITPYDSTLLVEANFHSKWGAAIKNDKVKAEMLRGIDGFGGEVCYTYWVRPVEIEPTPEPEESEAEEETPELEAEE